MSTELWGPALDAEIAYRRARLVEGLRDARAHDRRTRDHRDGPARPAVHPDAPARAARPPRRRWWLVGSGAWHTAR